MNFEGLDLFFYTPHINMYCFFIRGLVSVQSYLQVPPGIYDEKGRSLNRKSIYISKNSPRQVCEAYAKQFLQEDFSLFLKARSEEVVCGGRMVLVMTGRNGPEIFSRGNTLLWEILFQSFRTLVSNVSQCHLPSVISPP